MSHYFRSTKLVIAGIFTLLLGCARETNIPQNPNLTYHEYTPEKTDRVIDREAYMEKLEGFWLGTCIANWTGLVTEMDKIGNVGEIKTGDFYTRHDWGKPDQPNIFSQGNPSSISPIIDFVYAEPDSVWGADDDTDIEYIYQELLLKNQTSILTGEQIRDGWLRHIRPEEENYLWVSNQKAFDLMQQGIVPPHTGDPENNPEYEMIDAQLTTEIFGLYAPTRPDIALKMAQLPIQTTARENSEWISEFYVAMFSLASAVDETLPIKDQIFWMAEMAKSQLPESSYSYKMYEYVKLKYNEGLTWEQTRDSIYYRYQVNSKDGYDFTERNLYCNGCFTAGINFAASLVSLFYGEGDIVETIKIGTLAGWDSDNPTATWGGLLGFMIGKEGVEKAFKKKFSNQFHIHRTRQGFENDGIDTFENMALKGIWLIDRVVQEEMGGGVDLKKNVWYIPVEKGQKPADLVNLFIGTDKRGNTIPAATAPFGMISCGPDNVFTEVVDEYSSRSGYRWEKDSIRAFSVTHVSGWGCHGALDIPVMPTTKSPENSPVYNQRAYASAFSHERETAQPGYYQVFLDDYQTNVQITASERSAIMLVDFPNDQPANLIISPTLAANGITGAELTVDASNNMVTGWATSGGFCWRDPNDHDYTVYFAAQFDKPFQKSGFWNNQTMLPGLETISGDSIAAWLSFGRNLPETLEMRIAISFVSIENARENLEIEIDEHTFASLHDETSQKWNNLLSKVELNSPDRDLKVIGYTALYRNLLHPNIFNDVNGEYRGFNDSVYTMPAGHNKYVNFSTWDTYRTSAYLQRLLVPDRAADMIESLYLDANQGNPAGLTIWGYFNNETWVMNGHGSVPLIANMYAMGARDIDLTKIKNEMIRTADTKYRNGDEYIKYGYVPDRPAPHNYSVSQTLEYSIGDFGLAQICRADRDDENYQRYLARSQSVFNLLNPQTGYLQRKDTLGYWVVPFDKAEEYGFNEGNSAQYTWNIPHDMPQLMEKIGGSEKTIERLDEFTSQILQDGWNVNKPYYWPGNEPGFVVPFVYTYADAPEKTQTLIRKVVSEIFRNAPDGMPGDDDLGATSGMSLFFTLGMYPLKPGVPEFCLTGSLYESVKIRLDNGSEINISTTGDPWSKLKSIKFDGEILEEPFLNINNIIDYKGKIEIEYEY